MDIKNCLIKLQNILKEIPYQAEFREDFYQQLVNEGFFDVNFRQALTEKKLSLNEMIELGRMMGHYSIGLSTSFVAQALAAAPIDDYASPQLKKKFQNDFQKNPGFLSFAMTESQCGFDVGNTQTKAIFTQDDHIIINGEKNWITNGTISKHVIVFAQVVDSAGNPKGITCFYVPGNASGLTRSEPTVKMGMPDADNGHIYFKDVKIPIENQLGKVGQGLEILQRSLGRSKTIIAASCVGVCEKLQSMAIEHLSSRIKAGRSLVKNPLVQSQLAKIEIQREASWLLTQRAAQVWDAGELAVYESSMAKAFAADMAVNACSEAMELVGARSYFSDHEISQVYKDLKIVEIYEGTTVIQELIVAKEFFDRLKAKEVNKEVAQKAA